MSPCPFVPPRLPDDLESMGEDELVRVREQFRRRHIHFFYPGFTQRMKEPHWHALSQEKGLIERRIFNDDASPWEGLNTLLQMDITLILQNWPQITCDDPDGITPVRPIILSEQEVQRRVALYESLHEVDSEM